MTSRHRGTLSRRLVGILFLLLMLLASYVAGAAVIHFRLPTSDFFLKAFVGGVALQERGQAFEPSVSLTDKPLLPGVVIDLADQTDTGFTLLTTTVSSRAELLDMKGKVVHHWELPFDQAWPKAPHVKSQLPNDKIQWFTAHLFPNGDLLAIYQAENDSPTGYGLVKLDQRSKIIWKYPQNAHHTVDVGDDGKVYTMVQRNLFARPAGLEEIPSPYSTDFLVILSSEGQELASLSILEAFLASPYATLFKTLLMEHLRAGESDPFAPPLLLLPGEENLTGKKHLPGFSQMSFKPGMAADIVRFSGNNIKAKGDLLHGNSAKVLSRALAPRFPQFRAGQVMVSLRTLDLIAVIDPETKAVVWASAGIWRGQHDPEFLPNGHILIYDNFGSRLGTRILEYDPQTQAVTWVYSGEKDKRFLAMNRGMKQRLKNGNTLIVDPEPGSLLEVSTDKNIVWQINPLAERSAMPGAITSAHRYHRTALAFLDMRIQPRP